MAFDKFVCYGWVCSECTSLIANGDTPPEMDENETAEWLASINKRMDGYHVTYGGEHSFEDGCRNVDAEGNWIGDTDCSCEVIDHSTKPCDSCGTNLHGYRHSVGIWEN